MTSLALVVTSAPNAAAHDELISSSPSADARLDSAPTSITLGFNAPPLPIGSTVIVMGADGTDWVDAAPSAADTAVSAPLRPGMPDGNYQVRWRVVSSDGAVVSGFYDFGIGDLSGAAPVPSPQRATAGAGRDPAGDFDLQPTAPTNGAASQEATRPMARTVLVGLLGAVAAVGLYAIGAVLAGRRDDPSDLDPPLPTTTAHPPSDGPTKGHQP